MDFDPFPMHFMRLIPAFQALRDIRHEYRNAPRSRAWYTRERVCILNTLYVPALRPMLALRRANSDAFGSACSRYYRPESALPWYDPQYQANRDREARNYHREFLSMWDLSLILKGCVR